MNTTSTDNKIEFMVWEYPTSYHNGKLRKQSGFVNNTIQYLVHEESFSKNRAIMQLTALRSTTGQKIYNHMIVKNEIGSHYIVDMFDYTIMYILSNEKLEIVGNRFQHSELLELCE